MSMLPTEDATPSILVAKCKLGLKKLARRPQILLEWIALAMCMIMIMSSCVEYETVTVTRVVDESFNLECKVCYSGHGVKVT